MEAFHAWLSAGEKTSAPGGALHGSITYALKRMAELLTLLHTARLNGLEPVAWLRDVLEKLPSWPASRLDELLPYHRQSY